ncbi:MAG TPA: hypothetical protein PLD10_20930 [Rhodopila sp.]|nr:hypothetical protein [Rhodopila sp.]
MTIIKRGDHRRASNTGIVEQSFTPWRWGFFCMTGKSLLQRDLLSFGVPLHLTFSIKTA